MSIGSIIKCERKNRGWSQEKLAQKLRISRTTLGKYERDEILVDLNTLISISKLFHLSISELFEEKKQK